MCGQSLTKPCIRLSGQTIRIAVMCFLAALCGRDVAAQSLGFVPTSPKAGHTVSVRDLQIPSKARGKFEQGLNRLANYDPEGSLPFFEAAIAAAPDFYEAYYHRGVAELQMNRNDDALKSFQAAIDLSNGHYPRAEFGYGLVLTRKGDAKAAEQVVRHGLQTDANIPDGHVVLALVLLGLNRLDEAEKSAQEALLLNQTTSAKAHLILADIRGERGDFSGQARELDAYLQRYPKDRNHKFIENMRDLAKKICFRKASGQ
jgi:tetratricopeptide (TPR) repeat protein